MYLFALFASKFLFGQQLFTVVFLQAGTVAPRAAAHKITGSIVVQTWHGTQLEDWGVSAIMQPLCNLPFRCHKMKNEKLDFFIILTLRFIKAAHTFRYIEHT
jgi:hypothetical protein